jgi:primary-amine oxidase
VDGLVGVIDLTAGVVTAVHDLLDLPVPSERGRWDAPPHAVEPRSAIPGCGAARDAEAAASSCR